MNFSFNIYLAVIYRFYLDFGFIGFSNNTNANCSAALFYVHATSFQYPLDIYI